MYNGRDGVMTDDNGLIYMRARYYSPELRRFVNADIIAGSIVNAITLNRYAYANANPVSFVDPLGLSVEERTKAAKNMEEWAKYLKHLFAVSNSHEFDIPFGNGRLYLTNTGTIGSGDIEFQNIIDERNNLFDSISISADNINITIDENSVIGFEFSSDIDDNNTLSILLTYDPLKLTKAIELTIKTQLSEDNYVSTTLGYEHQYNNQKKYSKSKFRPETEFDVSLLPLPSTSKSPSSNLPSVFERPGYTDHPQKDHKNNIGGIMVFATIIYWGLKVGLAYPTGGLTLALP